MNFVTLDNFKKYMNDSAKSYLAQLLIIDKTIENLILYREHIKITEILSIFNYIKCIYFTEEDEEKLSCKEEKLLYEKCSRMLTVAINILQ